MVGIALILSMSGGLAACGGSGSDETVPGVKLPKSEASELKLVGVEVGDGTVRDYSVYEPGGTPTAAVVILDSFSLVLTEAQHPRAILLEEAKRSGFVLVVPQGIDETWNAGECCGTALMQNANDVGFLDAVFDDVAERYDFARPQISLVGWSGGGVMAYRMACEHAERFGAVAVVQGLLLTKPCKPAIEVDLLQIHQRGDAALPFGGTKSSILVPGGVLPSVPKSYARWLTAQECGPERSESAGPVETTTATCRNKTRSQLVVVEGGDENWPVGTGDSIDATSLVLDYFEIERTG